MKILLQLLLAQKLISSKCVLFINNLLRSETVPSRKSLTSAVQYNPRSGYQINLSGKSGKSREFCLIKEVING